jgi:hypothetical protein
VLLELRRKIVCSVLQPLKSTTTTTTLRSENQQFIQPLRNKYTPKTEQNTQPKNLPKNRHGTSPRHSYSIMSLHRRLWCGVWPGYDSLLSLQFSLSPSSVTLCGGNPTKGTTTATVPTLNQRAQNSRRPSFSSNQGLEQPFVAYPREPYGRYTKPGVSNSRYGWILPGRDSVVCTCSQVVCGPVFVMSYHPIHAYSSGAEF